MESRCRTIGEGGRERKSLVRSDLSDIRATESGEEGPAGEWRATQPRATGQKKTECSKGETRAGAASSSLAFSASRLPLGDRGSSIRWLARVHDLPRDAR